METLRKVVCAAVWLILSLVVYDVARFQPERFLEASLWA